MEKSDMIAFDNLYVCLSYFSRGGISSFCAYETAPDFRNCYVKFTFQGLYNIQIRIIRNNGVINYDDIDVIDSKTKEMYPTKQFLKDTSEARCDL